MSHSEQGMGRRRMSGAAAGTAAPGSVRSRFFTNGHPARPMRDEPERSPMLGAAVQKCDQVKYPLRP